MEGGKYLEQAVEELYEAFSSYKLRPRVEGCPCCTDPDEERALHALPLRQLGADALQPFVHSALMTWGTAYDFRHFLPRLLELALQKATLYDLPDLFGKLRCANWEQWPRREREAITKYLHAFWRFTLSEERDDYEIHEVEERLCAVSCTTDDIELFLDAFLDPPRASALQNFDAWLRSDRALSDAFWEPEPRTRARAWLKSPQLAARLEEMFFEVDEELQPLVSRALDRLAWIV